MTGAGGEQACRHAVDVNREQIQASKVATEQLGEPGGLSAAKAPRDRRARGAAALDLAERLGAGQVAPGRKPGEHPPERHLVKQVTGGEALVGGQRHLPALLGPSPRTFDLEQRAAERNQSRLGAMAVGAEVGVVLPLGATDPGDVRRP